jgi:acetyl-CoA C-acetyltransferase
MKNSRPVYIVGGVRTPFMKSMTKYIDVTSNELMTETLRQLVRQYNLQGKTVGDVALGAVMKNSSNWGQARECVLSSGLNPRTPAYNSQRACGTGLENAWEIANKISTGAMESGIAGGVDTNSDLPFSVKKSLGNKLIHLNAAKSLPEKIKIILSIRPSEFIPVTPAVVEPRTGMSMGEHCELMVKEWKINRQAQDELAVLSHQNGERAYKEGFFEDMVFDFHGFKKDGTLRGDTTMEKVSKLKPAFDRSEAGTLTAANSSPLTDGASAVLLASEEECKKNGWPMLARFVEAQVAAVDYVGGEGLLMAPTIAVAQMLHRNNLKLQDFDYYEIHEAFAGQVLCTLKAWEDPEYAKKNFPQGVPLGSIDRAKMNVNGSSLALGHPFAATGGRIVATLAKLLNKKGSGRGLISICTAGGMGVVAIIEK